MTMPSYYLSPATFICMANNQLVFLNLHEDKYQSLDREATQKMRSFFQKNMTTRQCLDDEEAPGRDSQEIAKTLIGQGLLTLDRASGKTITLTSVLVPDREINGCNIMESPGISVGQLCSAFSAILKARFKLRFFSLEKIAKQVGQRKLKANTSLSSMQVGELIGRFKRLRPLLFTANNHCLFDTLALIEFLAIYNIYPDWVFGVRMGPFRAHCWIQSDTAIFNDSVANVASYTPILKL